MDFSQKQIDSLAESTARINIWEGSVRSGKTYISLWRFIKELKEGPEGDYLIICRTYDAFKRNLLDILTGICKANARYYIGKRELHLFGKRVHVVGADDSRSESKIRGMTAKGAYVDEISIIAEDVWLMLISRCAMGEARIFGTTNPDSPLHWLKVGFLSGNNPDVRSWQFRLDDNPDLTDKAKDFLRRQYKGLWYQRFIEGLWVQAEGAIYDTFDANLHVIKHGPKQPQYCVIGVDYGTANPCAFTSIAVNTSAYPNMWIEDEYYYDSKAQQRQKTDAEYAADLISFCKGKPVKAIYIDPSAASFRLELQRQGVSNLYDAENEVIDGVRFVSKLLNEGTLKICRNCTHLLKEIQSYVWDPKSAKTGVDKPMKAFDHVLDSLRYACYTHFFNKSLSSMSAIELDNSWREAMGGGDANLPDVFRSPESYQC